MATAIIGELNDPTNSPEGRAAITDAVKEDGLPALTDENGWVVSKEGLNDYDKITLDFGSCLLPNVSYELVKNENGEYSVIDRYYFRLRTNGILYSFANKEELDQILGDNPCQTLAASGN